MARKDLLKDLISSAQNTPTTGEAVSDQPESVRAPRTGGAIGAVSRSIAELKARSVVEIPADLIDAGGLEDRLGDDAAEDAALRHSLATYGQQVPVLVRHDPNHEGRYQIIYGRRRVAALKALGQPVRAMVHDLDDRQLIVAQGQENTARRDLSFIEKANFGRQMEEMGFSRAEICDVINVDKTVVSRMLKVMAVIPRDLVLAIGPAPNTGRDNWQKLASAIEGQKVGQLTLKAADSDARFLEAMQKLTAVNSAGPAGKASSKPEVINGADGASLGSVKRGKAGMTLAFRKADGFDDWLLENMDRLHREYRSRNGG